MSVHVILIAYALDIRPMVRSFMSDDVTLHLFIHSDRFEVVKACQIIESEYPNVILYNYFTNRGLGKSCNEGIYNALNAHADVIIVPNDDVQLDRADFDRLLRGCLDHPECGLIQCYGFNADLTRQQPMGFSCFGINRTMVERVGYFDRNLPDYFCDCDYGRRGFLAGVPTHNIGETNVVHTGSATIEAVPKLKVNLQITFPADSAYYERKWGGQPGAETFVTPFNEGGSLRIGEDTWDCPYPAQQRSDAEIARP